MLFLDLRLALLGVLCLVCPLTRAVDGRIVLSKTNARRQRALERNEDERRDPGGPPGPPRMANLPGQQQIDAPFSPSFANTPQGGAAAPSTVQSAAPRNSVDPPAVSSASLLSAFDHQPAIAAADPLQSAHGVPSPRAETQGHESAAYRSASVDSKGIIDTVFGTSAPSTSTTAAPPWTDAFVRQQGPPSPVTSTAAPSTTQMPTTSSTTSTSTSTTTTSTTTSSTTSSAAPSPPPTTTTPLPTTPSPSATPTTAPFAASTASPTLSLKIEDFSTFPPPAQTSSTAAPPTATTSTAVPSTRGPSPLAAGVPDLFATGEPEATTGAPGTTEAPLTTTTAPTPTSTPLPSTSTTLSPLLAETTTPPPAPPVVPTTTVMPTTLPAIAPFAASLPTTTVVVSTAYPETTPGPLTSEERGAGTIAFDDGISGVWEADCENNPCRGDKVMSVHQEFGPMDFHGTGSYKVTRSYCYMDGSTRQCNPATADYVLRASGLVTIAGLAGAPDGEGVILCEADYDTVVLEIHNVFLKGQLEQHCRCGSQVAHSTAEGSYDLSHCDGGCESLYNRTEFFRVINITDLIANATKCGGRGSEHVSILETPTAESKEKTLAYPPNQCFRRTKAFTKTTRGLAEERAAREGGAVVPSHVMAAKLAAPLMPGEHKVDVTIESSNNIRFWCYAMLTSHPHDLPDELLMNGSFVRDYAVSETIYGINGTLNTGTVSVHNLEPATEYLLRCFAVNLDNSTQRGSILNETFTT
ncbi:unnamed protein product [Vitrella brassicaformis CCMP3155]|uniref:Fibronectin type-III domain-containing protein n=1 Tax=Vitrella brassicaformis (strain CCMP3155) TaxID=1169540 RepID=A0A0G4EGS1_VITBC|nr:unnamed protein product [Vitrella brassicaformis CCMP3155]|eukprot:CEL94700.1 unnamed protein product [Vitrella brassicaformis CCMP3155]